MSGILAIGLAAAWAVLPAAGAALELGRSPVLSATLPASSTWQVEQQQASGTWTGTGVLVGGSGAAGSVRMDGFPAEAKYRFQRVAGGAGTVTPALSFGLALAGEQAGAGQVLIEASADLSAAGWSDLALLYPDAGGRYVRAIREPLGPRGFFRAKLPALAAGDATATAHQPVPPYDGAAGFGPVYDDMPQLFKDGFIGALDPVEYNRGGANAAAAGECYELAGPFGRTTVIISDTTTAPAGTVDVGRSFFDLGPNAYQVMSGGPATGALTAGMRLVPAPVTGNVKCFVPTASGPFYAEFRPYNYRAGVSKLEIRNAGSSTWLELPRSAYNSFVFNGSGGVPLLLFPLGLRVTSRFGEVVDFPAILAAVSNQRFTASAQFTVFPESALAPVPERRLRPIYHDSLTNVLGETWSASPYGGAAVTEIDHGVPAYGGSAASLKIAGYGGFAGVNFQAYPDFPRPEYGVLKLAIRSASPIAAGQLGVSIFGANAPASGTIAYATSVELPGITTGWQLIQIPLEASKAPPVLWGFTLYSGNAALPEVWVDEVGFEKR